MKMVMGKVLPWILIGTLVVSLAGCAKSSDGSGQGKETVNQNDSGQGEETVAQGGINQGEGSFSGESNDEEGKDAQEAHGNNSQEASMIDDKYIVAMANYPEMAPYPDEMSYVDEDTGEFDSEGFSKVYDAWWEDKLAQQAQPEGYDDGLNPFFDASIRQFLSGSEDKNRVYSPLNVYMALAMLAEVTDGNSRQQILELVGADSIEALRSQARAIWNSNYSDDGAVTSILASSLWLNENVNFKQATMDALAENYYASAFAGKMGSEEFDKALQSWLNEQTGGLLKEQASGIHMDANTIMSLASSIYFRAKWASEFSENSTEADVFHGADGDITCDFMHKSDDRSYYWGDKFAAVALRLEGSGSMWLVLPDEGVSVDELLQDSQVMEFFHEGDQWKNNNRLIVNMAVPKFDVVSDLDLIPGLKTLGITDVFDASISVFTPLTADTDQIFLSQAKHAARVKIDEEGVVAAAYTVMMAAGAAEPPEKKVDFVLDRPFLFMLTGQDGLPLFTGVVNQPE